MKMVKKNILSQITQITQIGFLKRGFKDKDFRNEDLRISGFGGFNSSGMAYVAGGRCSADLGTGGRCSADLGTGGRCSAVFGAGGRRSAVFYSALQRAPVQKSRIIGIKGIYKLECASITDMNIQVFLLILSSFFSLFTVNCSPFILHRSFSILNSPFSI